MYVPVTPTATANYGDLNIGSGPFDGVTSGFFNGNSNGTHIAINAASAFAGNLIDVQVAGVPALSMSPTGAWMVRSTVALESGSLGPEITDATGWTSTDWTGSYGAGFAHTIGNTTALSRTMTNTIGQLYQVSWTVTGRTVGSFTVTLGGQLSPSSYTASGNIGPGIISTNGPLIFTPTTDFDGTISNISVKLISQYLADIEHPGFYWWSCGIATQHNDWTS